MTSETKTLQMYFNTQSLQEAIDQGCQDFLIEVSLDEANEVLSYKGLAYNMMATPGPEFAVCPHPCVPPKPAPIPGSQSFTDRMNNTQNLGQE